MFFLKSRRQIGLGTFQLSCCKYLLTSLLGGGLFTGFGGDAMALLFFLYQVLGVSLEPENKKRKPELVLGS